MLGASPTFANEAHHNLERNLGLKSTTHLSILEFLAGKSYTIHLKPVEVQRWLLVTRRSDHGRLARLEDPAAAFLIALVLPHWLDALLKPE